MGLHAKHLETWPESQVGRGKLLANWSGPAPQGGREKEATAFRGAEGQDIEEALPPSYDDEAPSADNETSPGEPAESCTPLVSCSAG